MMWVPKGANAGAEMRCRQQPVPFQEGATGNPVPRRGRGATLRCGVTSTTGCLMRPILYLVSGSYRMTVNRMGRRRCHWRSSPDGFDENLAIDPAASQSSTV